LERDIVGTIRISEAEIGLILESGITRGIDLEEITTADSEKGTAKPPAQDPFGGFVSGFVGFAGQNASLVGILLLIAVALILLQAVTAQPKNESRPWLKK
jgi:hypothetical protein